VVAAGRERVAIESLAEAVREELNVRSVRFVAAAEELGRYEVKANYRTLGPLFGKDMPLAAQAIASLDPARVAAVLRQDAAGDAAGEEVGDAGADARRGIGITVSGREHVLSEADVIMTLRAPEGYSVEREGAHAVALDLTIDEDLRREGYAREIVHAVQNARRSAGLAVEDRIALWLAGDEALMEAAGAPRAATSSAPGTTPRSPTSKGARWGSRCAAPEGRQAAASAGSSSCSSRFFGYAPITVFTGCPPLKRIIVGIESTWKLAAVCWLSSMFSFTTRSSGRSAAISSSTGATTRHGPHQGAQKSTSTGPSASMTSAWKLLSVTSFRVPAITSPWSPFPSLYKV